ncbi:MAG: hypothetical protein AAF716_05050 [Cyanobacteria bacterium P01_D01_bin.1]
MVITYCVTAGITFITLLIAFIKDGEALAEPEAIPFILLSTLLGPVTLPCIIFSKIKRLRNRPQASQHYSARSSYGQRTQSVTD